MPAGLVRNSFTRLRALANIGFIRRVGMVSVATSTGQLLGMLNLAALAMLVPQAELGIYSVFIAYAMVAASINLLSLDATLPNLDTTRTRAMVHGLLLVLSAIALLVGVGFAVWGYGYSVYLGLLVFAIGLSKISERVNIRDQKYFLLAISRLFTPGLFALFIAVLYVNDALSIPRIIIGYSLIALLSGVLYALLSLRAYIGFPTLHAIWHEIFEARNNVKYVASGELLNHAAHNIPTIMLGHFFGTAIAAQYAITLKFISGPLNMVTAAITQIYHGILAKDAREMQDGARVKYNHMVRHLTILGMIIGAGIVVAAPIFFPLMLGDGWDLAILMAQLLSPMFVLTFITTPLSMMFYVYQQQHHLFFYQLLFFLVSAFSFTVGVLMEDVVLAIGLFSVLACLRYVGLYLRLRKIAHAHMPSEATNA